MGEMEVVWPTPMTGKVDGQYGVVYPIIRVRDHLVAVVHTVSKTFYITCSGALPGDRIGDKCLADVLKSEETVMQHVRSFVCSYVVFRFKELQALSIRGEEAKLVMESLDRNTAYRGCFPSTPERSKAIQERREIDIMLEFPTMVIPDGAFELVSCGNGHTYCLEDRICAAKATKHDFITCGVEGCTQRVPFSTLLHVNLSPGAFSALSHGSSYPMSCQE